MPELPEVETVVRTLEDRLSHFTIRKVDVLYEKMIYNYTSIPFEKALVNESVLTYSRLGKYMIFELTHYYLIAHMRMEGKFYIQKQEDKMDKHTHVIFSLDNCQLRYHDTRKFGRMYLYDKSIPYVDLDVFKNVGLDAFDEHLDVSYINSKIGQRSISVKQFLLDQSNIAGIGNIYADEICFACKIHPTLPVNKLKKKDIENILVETRRILGGAIKAGGTTIRSYTSQLKVDGRFQLQLKVHQQINKPCQICGTTIEKIKHHGRGTYFCKKCQKRK